MSALFEAQVAFGQNLPKLLKMIDDSGLIRTFGRLRECADCKIGHPKSLHKLGLAIDINLFDLDRVYLTRTEDHEPFGIFWESLGGAWGGRFHNPPDGNHYSWPYKGMR